jgi:hypothetical protein
VARIIDLDVVAPEDTIVIIAGVEYLLPGDVPVPHMLAIERASRDFFSDEENDNGSLIRLQDEILDLFRIRQPDLEELPPLGLAGLIQFVQALYGAPEDEPDPPKPARKGGTPNTRRKTTTRKASGS